MRVRPSATRMVVIAALAGLQPALAQTSAIAVPPPPAVASVPAQPLTPRRVITPAKREPARAAAPAYRLVQPPLNAPAGGPAELRWNSGGGGAMPILGPGHPQGNTPQSNVAPINVAPSNAANQPQPAIAVPPTAQNFASAAPPLAPPPNPWLPRQNAVLGVLNQEDGAISRLAVQVGNSVVQGRLKITVLACVTRPNTLPPDAAVFLSIQNIQQDQQTTDYQAVASSNHAGGFKGWLLRSEPGASVPGGATELFRLIGCGSF